MRQSSQGQCTGMTLRDGMGREVAGGFRMWNTCTPMANVNIWQHMYTHAICEHMAKPLQYCKVISLQLK